MTDSWTVDPALQWIARLALSLLLLWSAAHKLRDLEFFRLALGAYRLLPAAVLPATPIVLISLELGIALALIVPGWSPVPAAAAAALLSLYSAAIAVNLLRGRRSIDCGCAGPAAHRPIGSSLLLRNFVLLLVAFLCGLPASSRGWLWLDAMVVTAGVATAVLLYVAAELAVANAQHQRMAVAANRGPR